MSIQLKQLDYVIVYVSDMQRSLAFYRDTLGLTLKFTSPGWTEFVTGSATIALHVVGGGGEQSPARQSLPPAGQAPRARPARREPLARRRLQSKLTALRAR